MDNIEFPGIGMSFSPDGRQWEQPASTRCWPYSLFVPSSPIVGTPCIECLFIHNIIFQQMEIIEQSYFFNITLNIIKNRYFRILLLSYPHVMSNLIEGKTHSSNSSLHSSLDFSRLGNVETSLSLDCGIVGISSGIEYSVCSALTICVVIIQIFKYAIRSIVCKAHVIMSSYHHVILIIILSLSYSLMNRQY